VFLRTLCNNNILLLELTFVFLKDSEACTVQYRTLAVVILSVATTSRIHKTTLLFGEKMALLFKNLLKRSSCNSSSSSSSSNNNNHVMRKISPPLGGGGGCRCCCCWLLVLTTITIVLTQQANTVHANPNAIQMLALLQDDELEHLERSKIVSAYKSTTSPSNDYLVQYHHNDDDGDDIMNNNDVDQSNCLNNVNDDNDDDDRKTKEGPNACQAEPAARRSVFPRTGGNNNDDDNDNNMKEDDGPLVCLAFLSCCGRTDLLQLTLNAAIRHMEQDEPTALRKRYEIAWVDNGSSRDKQEHIRSTFQIDHALPMPRNMGLAWGMNALLFDLCTAPYILLLEEDWLYMDKAVAEPTKPRKEAIAHAIALLQSNPVDPATRRPIKGVFLRTESNIVPTTKGVLENVALQVVPSKSTTSTTTNNNNNENEPPYTVDRLEYRISCMQFQQTGHIWGAFTNGAGLYDRQALTTQIGRMYGEPGDVFSDLAVEGNFCFRVGLQFCAARIPMDSSDINNVPQCDYDTNPNIPASCAAAFAHIGGGRGTRPARRKHMKCIDDAWNFYGTPFFDQVPKEACSKDLGTIWEQLKLNEQFQAINDAHNKDVFQKEQQQRNLMVQMANLFQDKSQRPAEFRAYFGSQDPQYAKMSDEEIRKLPEKLRNMAASPHQLPGFWDILGRPVGVDFDVP